VTASVLLSLGYSFSFIEDWPKQEQDHYKKKMLDILDLNKAVASSLEAEPTENAAPVEAGKKKNNQPSKAKTA
jgi:hypothetical protein